VSMTADPMAATTTAREGRRRPAPVTPRATPAATTRPTLLVPDRPWSSIHHDLQSAGAASVAPRCGDAPDGTPVWVFPVNQPARGRNGDRRPLEGVTRCLAPPARTSMPRIRHAVVIGASMAGLTTARAGRPRRRRDRARPRRPAGRLRRPQGRPQGRTPTPSWPAAPGPSRSCSPGSRPR
jgi:hypothetical protein